MRFPSVPVIVSSVEAITVVDDLLTKYSSSSLILSLSIPIVTVMVFVYFRGLRRVVKLFCFPPRLHS